MPETHASQAESRRASSAGGDSRPRGGESSVSWLVLGLLIEQPSHGYELSQRYDERFGSFASLSVPRIYAALDRLRDGGMIEPVVLDSAKPVPKQHLMRRSYRVTAAGVHAYRGWVAERMREDPHRQQLLARVASAGSLGLDGVLDVIDRYERACLEELRGLRKVSFDPTGDEISDEAVAEYLIADQQSRELNARREWAAHAREILRAQIDRRARGNRTPR